MMMLDGGGGEHSGCGTDQTKRGMRGLGEVETGKDPISSERTRMIHIDGWYVHTPTDGEDRWSTECYYLMIVVKMLAGVHIRHMCI